MHFTLRRATACDADAIASVYLASFRLLTFLPMLHTIEGYRWFIANVILNECEVTVAEDESGIVAFIARQGEEVRLLYTRPDRIGMGAGTQLTISEDDAYALQREIPSVEASAPQLRGSGHVLEHREERRRLANQRGRRGSGRGCRCGCQRRQQLTVCAKS